MLCFLCPCPLRLLSKVLRNHKTSCASGSSQAECQATGSNRKKAKKRKIKDCCLCPGDRCPLVAQEEGVSHWLPSLIPAPALGGAQGAGSCIWMRPLPWEKQPAAPSTGLLHLCPGPPEGQGPGAVAPSLASRSPAPRCLQVLWGRPAHAAQNSSLCKTKPRCPRSPMHPVLPSLVASSQSPWSQRRKHRSSSETLSHRSRELSACKASKVDLRDSNHQKPACPQRSRCTALRTRQLDRRTTGPNVGAERGPTGTAVTNLGLTYGNINAPSG